MTMNEQQAKELEEMRNPSPEAWPLYPIRQVRNMRRGNIPVFGVLCAWDGRPIIYLDASPAQLGTCIGSGWKISDKAVSVVIRGEGASTPAIPLREKLSKYQIEEYTSFEAMQDAGWVAD